MVKLVSTSKFSYTIVMYQPQDYYFKKAKKEGYPARSVYKLEEIDKKFHILHHNDIVLDLGCAPGSWLLYIQKRIQPSGKLIGIDLKPIKIKIPVIFFQRDIFQLKPEELKEILSKESKEKFDVIVSDLAPATSGVKDLDEERSLELIKQAYSFVPSLLKNEGFFVCKAFESYEVHLFAKKISPFFKRLKIFKPRASRKRSKELYLIGLHYLSS